MAIIENDKLNKDLNNLVNLLMIYFNYEKIYLCKYHFTIDIIRHSDYDIEIKLKPSFEAARMILNIINDQGKEFLGYELLDNHRVQIKTS